MRWGDWLLTPQRVAVHLPTRTAVAADLHLGYDRVRRRGGEAVPERSIEEELGPLRRSLEEQGVSRLVIAGDLFEDGRFERDEMVEDLLGWAARHSVELTAVVPGNHDRGLGDATELPVRREGLRIAEWTVVHGDAARPEGPVVQGHEHPWLRWRPGVEGPCYLLAEGHLVLPAYSADAAGGNVLGQARWANYRACVIAGAQVLDFGPVGQLRREGVRG
jgi:putative SbcD/Mre11-related phosphoesterase